MIELRRDQLKYWPYYCEENIWHLSQTMVSNGLNATVIFISNPARTCFFTNQRLGNVVWDYHVVLEAGGRIFDLDSALPFPCPTARYVLRSFVAELDTQFLPVFKKIGAEIYLESFYSDRRHMRDSVGEYTQDPPPWPAIQPQKGSNLDWYIDMSNPEPGQLVNFDFLYQKALKTYQNL